MPEIFEISRKSCDFWIFSVSLKKQLTLLTFDPHARNACRVIALAFRFQNPSSLKNKCGFLTWFLKKKSFYASHAFPSIFEGGGASHNISFSVLLRDYRNKNFWKIHICYRDTKFFAKFIHSFIQTLRIKKKLQGKWPHFRKFFSFFLIFFGVSDSIFLEFLPGS